jgi:hypothetical protein
MLKRKIKLSKHSIERWRERVNLPWSPGSIADYIYRHFVPKLQEGIKPYIIDERLYYILYLGKLEEKATFVILTPEADGEWSGWTAVTFLNDDVIDDLSDYFSRLKEKAEGVEGEYS